LIVTSLSKVLCQALLRNYICNQCLNAPLGP
jgi:hypothetical protein